MKRHLYLFVLLLLATFLGACGPSSVEPEPTEASGEPALQEPAGEDVMPRATITATAAPEEAYPTRPTPAPLGEGYPQPETLPADNPYPGVEPAGEGRVWVTVPAGLQCEEALKYPTEEDAVASLETAGIEVYESQAMELPVPAVCGGPTSLQFLALIDADKLSDAEALDWEFAQ